MLHNIDLEILEAIRERDPEAAHIIDTLLQNHARAISTISHELRNPLTLINSGLQIIESQHPEVVTFKFWDSTMHTVDFTKCLLNELTKLNNSRNLNIATVAPSAFLRQISLSFASSVERDTVSYDSRITPFLPPLPLDQTKVTEVLINLFRNAREAIGDKKDGHISMTVTDEEIGDFHYILITISDNGCGISEENISSIFEPFKTFKPDGTGLGLAISKNIIEAHNATLSVASTVGEGSSFTIRFTV